MLEQTAQLAQRCCVRGERQRELDAFYCPDGLVARQKEHSRGCDEDHTEPQDRGTSLALLWDGHGEADRARDSVHARRSATI
eukprot:1288538-Pleurochrysis_carterae.AAC.1